MIGDALFTQNFLEAIAADDPDLEKIKQCFRHIIKILVSIILTENKHNEDAELFTTLEFVLKVSQPVADRFLKSTSYSCTSGLFRNSSDTDRDIDNRIRSVASTQRTIILCK